MYRSAYVQGTLILLNNGSKAQENDAGISDMPKKKKKKSHKVLP